MEAATLTSSSRNQAEKLSGSELRRHTVERRAIEAVIWGMPAVNFDLMYQATLQSKGEIGRAHV